MTEVDENITLSRDQLRDILAAGRMETAAGITRRLNTGIYTRTFWSDPRASADTWERTCQDWMGQPHKLAFFLGAHPGDW